MIFTYIKNRFKKLEKNDITKVLYDLVLGDLLNIPTYQPFFPYMKNDVVYYFDEAKNRHYIIKCNVTLTNPTELPDFKFWEVLSGEKNQHYNKSILDKLGVNLNGRLTFNKRIVGSQNQISETEPTDQEVGDFWVQPTSTITPPIPPDITGVIVSNMVVQPNEPSIPDEEILWGDNSYDIIKSNATRKDIPDIGYLLEAKMIVQDDRPIDTSAIWGDIDEGSTVETGKILPVTMRQSRRNKPKR